MVVQRNLWRWTLFLLFLTAVSVSICGVLYLALRSTLTTNSALIKQLQVQGVEALHREQSLRRVVLANQQAVKRLHGTPVPLPPELRTAGSSAASSRAPAPSTRLSPRVRTSPAPRSSPRPSAHPSPSSIPRPSASPSEVCVTIVCIRP